MRRSVSLFNTSDSESTRHHVLEESFRVSRNNQADAQRESAQNLLARGVKRRTHSDAQQPSLNIACPRKLATQHISVEPFTSKHSQHADSQSEAIGMPGAFSNDYKQTLPPRGSMQHWKSVLGPVQEAGTCSSAWPIKKGALARPSPHWRHVQEVDADVAVDVDCCGDSGSMSKLCSAAPPFCLKRPLRNSSVSATSHEGVKAQALVRRSAPVSTDIDMRDVSLPVATTPRMRHAGSELSEQQASSEMAFRLNHARQTVEFVQRQAASFGRLDKVKLGVWEALQLLDSSQDPNGVHPTSLADQHTSAVEQAIHTAELCRLASPYQDWFHLVGLIHGLGKVMTLPRFGRQPEWAVSSESFPVGCRFSGNITCSHFFSVNPDRRRRLYSSATGMYQPGCGLAAVYMSWSAYEYLYLLLLKNKTALPPVARFVLRHCNFLALTCPGGAYSELLSNTDLAMMPWLRRFQAIQQSDQQACEGQVCTAQLRQYYNALIAKYIPGSKLQF